MPRKVPGSDQLVFQLSSGGGRRAARSGMRNIQGAQHGLSVDGRACDKTEVSVVRTDKL